MRTERMHRWRTVVAALAILISAAAVASGTAWAHVANERTQFPDIAQNPYAADILLLVAVDIVPQTPTFEPDKTLTRKDLAAWAAMDHRVDPGGESPDLAKLIQDGTPFLASVDGDATAGDINHAIFGDALTPANAAQTFTKAEAAHFIVSHLTPARLHQLGVTPGPTGAVTKVTTRTAADGDTAYNLTIAGQAWTVYEHPRVVGPTDLTLWQGGTVTRSYLKTETQGDEIVFAQLAQPSEATPATAGGASAAQPGQVAHAARYSWVWTAALLIVLAVLCGWLFVRHRPR